MTKPTYSHINAAVLGVRELSPAVRELSLGRTDGQPLVFAPGEYLLYWTGTKYAAFSLASSPLRPEEFTIAVARRGPATEQLHRAQIGEVLPLAGPFGPSFDQELLAGRNLWFIAGGIGLAGLAAQIRTVEADPGRFGKDHRLFYGVRNRAEAIWRDELQNWREFMTVDVTGNGRHLVGDLIHDRLMIPANITALVCGPRAMAHAVFPMLVKLGITPQHILTSIW